MNKFLRINYLGNDTVVNKETFCKNKKIRFQNDYLEL